MANTAISEGEYMREITGARMTLAIYATVVPVIKVKTSFKNAYLFKNVLSLLIISITYALIIGQNHLNFRDIEF